MDDHIRTFLRLEYESARELTFHVDVLRGRLTGLFVTVSGVVATVISLLSRDQRKPLYHAAIGVILIALAVLGALIVLIVAKLRSVQLEHFRIMNNIRTYFLKTDLEAWNVVELSGATLPGPTHRSGSYFWVLTDMLASLFSLAAGLLILISGSCRWWITGAVAVFWLVGLDRAYFALAQPPKRHEYKSLAEPFEGTV